MAQPDLQTFGLLIQAGVEARKRELARIAQLEKDLKAEVLKNAELTRALAAEQATVREFTSLLMGVEARPEPAHKPVLPEIVINVEEEEEEPAQDAIVLQSVIRRPKPPKPQNLFYCQLCGGDFSRKSNLTTHIARVHGVKLAQPLIAAATRPQAPVREVEPDPLMQPAELVGKRVRIWWNAERKWFDGTVTAVAGPRHKVLYDDGEEMEETLLGSSFPRRGWRLLEAA